jgi:hypothetical protein
MILRRATGTDPAMTATTTDTIPPDATAVTETTTMSAIGTTTATNPNVRLEGRGARASVVASAAQEGPGLGQYPQTSLPHVRSANFRRQEVALHN